MSKGSKSQPIPGSTGEVLTSLPSPYQPHGATGLLYLPRFITKIRYVQEHGQLPASYRKNYKRGLDRFLCMHLGLDPSDVEKAVMDAVAREALSSSHFKTADGSAYGDCAASKSTSSFQSCIDQNLTALFPHDVRAIVWNRELVQKGMTEAGRAFLSDALREMGCLDRCNEIKCVADLIDFDEGRIA